MPRQIQKRTGTHDTQPGSHGLARLFSIRISLLGSFKIERDGQPIRLPTRKIESLLAFLILHPEPSSRDKLATLFWGDVTDEQARHSLRTALNTLRKRLGADLLLADHETVQINPHFPLSVDAREIYGLRLLISDLADPNSEQISYLESQIENYQGDLLENFYDEWVLREREHFRQLYVETLLQLTQQMRTRSEYELAMEFASRVLHSDPSNERAHQHLMFCQVALGRRDAALQQYQILTQSLETELAVQPSPESIALYQWIQQTPLPGTAHAAQITNLPIPLSSFVGRKKEITQIKELLLNARLVTLTGAGGSGKTRLAIRVATDLEQIPV